FHIPISDGLGKVPDLARQRACTTVQIFSRPPRNWRINRLADDEVQAFRDAIATAGISPVCIHTQYLLNLASADTALRRRSVRALAREMDRAPLLGADYVITHLGSARGRRRCAAVRRVSRSIIQALSDAPAGPILLLENSAGSGDLIGAEFSEIGSIVRDCADAGVEVGVCLDIAHAFAAGYELTTARGLREALVELDGEVGLERLRVIHFNDSKTPLGSGVDRHWHIGKGKMGREGLRRIVRHPALQRLPFIMETPELDLKHDRMNMRAFKRLLL
ncbi:MAG: deoxyribonuclease IV, partial [Armatimonadota bacterium]